MSCQSCGHPAETVEGRPVQGHHIGCVESMAAKRLREHARNPVAPDPTASLCEHGECTNPKRPQGKGPKPKYCDEHSTPKSRKE
ncbi:hypothetical protein [Streptomyces formicae]|uniref:Phage protein n=1 Tax=Streptomyces formicae TaxID=1616117 RepID=A0ABY3WLW9_9ACTN|nr:hypothetical protein [Streptomyces formicae]UNM12337.1 hypothetical protein J4032_13030 [Streptomyces formicae]